MQLHMQPHQQRTEFAFSNIYPNKQIIHEGNRTRKYCSLEDADEKENLVILRSAFVSGCVRAAEQRSIGRAGLLRAPRLLRGRGGGTLLALFSFVG